MGNTSSRSHSRSPSRSRSRSRDRRSPRSYAFPSEQENQQSYSSSYGPGPYLQPPPNTGYSSEPSHFDAPPQYQPSTNPDVLPLPEKKQDDYAGENLLYPPGESSQAESSRSRRSNSYITKPFRKGSMEDALRRLRTFNTVFLVDDSGSMTEERRWEQAQHALADLANVAGQYDMDGIDVHFLNHTDVEGQRLKNTSAVNKLFSRIQLNPKHATPIGDRLEDLLLPYLADAQKAKDAYGLGAEFKKRCRPVNYIVITDGRPTDDPESVITNIATRLDNGGFPISQVGIQFVQVGTDKGATQYLNQLDNELTGMRDIVDTTPYLGQLSADMLVKVLLGGIDRRIDKDGAAV